MLYYVIKVLISAIIIVAISEISKRSISFAALAASLPLTSLLAFIWIYVEGSPSSQIAELSSQIFWLVLPSLLLFLVLPVLLKWGFNFWVSLSLSILATIIGYFISLLLLQKVGIRL